MTNEDLKRFYQENPNINEPGDFVRLDSSGKVPAKVLPSYVDDVVEGYYYNSKFYEDSDHTKEITPEVDKIYVDKTTGNTYRWGGTMYTPVGAGSASDISYDNTSTGLLATTVQGAIDEIVGDIGYLDAVLTAIDTGSGV